MADFMSAPETQIKQYPEAGGLNQGPRRLSMKERLLGEKRNLEARLSQIDEALTILGENPQIEKVLEILSKTIY